MERFIAHGNKITNVRVVDHVIFKNTNLEIVINNTTYSYKCNEHLECALQIFFKTLEKNDLCWGACIDINEVYDEGEKLQAQWNELRKS